MPRGQMAPTAERIRQVQRALAAGGHYHQEPTGRMDAATVAALTSFQQANGLEPSGGKLTAQTLIKLEQHGLPRSSRPPAEQGGASSSDK